MSSLSSTSIGHLIHGIMRGNTKWATGDLENDFIEAPSQMFEEWPKDPAILKTVRAPLQNQRAHSGGTGREGPRRRRFRPRPECAHSKCFTLPSASIFITAIRRDSTRTNWWLELQTRYTPYKFVEGTHMQTAFDHLNGYSAVYYTYMWSLVIAKDMFTEFKKNGLMNPEVAAKYRNSVLGASGTKPAADLVHDFLGRPYSFQAYADWLNGK